jgi:hypothetical protein
MQVQSVFAFEPTETNEEIFARIYREVSRGKAAPAVVCLVRPYVNTMGKIHLIHGKLEVRLNSLVADAPSPVREALAWILLSKLFRRKVPPVQALHYRQYMNRKEVRRTHQLVRQTKGRKFVSGPKGKIYDLDPLFDELCLKYFDGLMQKPQLGWSRGEARWLLGHFDHTHNAIILSRILDRDCVPRLAVEYVLYHEMLHLKHPVDHRGARRCVHTREFKADEKLFSGLKEAKEMLKRL